MTGAKIGDGDAVELRAGDIARVTSERLVRCRCSVCGRVFANTGAAWSHARSARHTVDVDYRTLFAFVPVQQVGRAKC